MEVRAHGAAGVAGKGNELLAGDRKKVLGRVEVAVVFTAVAQLGFDIGFDLWGEGVQVAVDGGIALGMAHVQGVSVAVGAHGDAGDVALCHGAHF